MENHVGKQGPQRRLASDFTLGGEQAEADPLLNRAFLSSGHFSAIESRHDDLRCFLIGRTGSGKSAVLQRIEETHRDHVVRINPEDLSLTYISGNGAVRYLAELNVHLDPLFIALWKHVLLIEIIRHRYKIDSASAKQNVLLQLREKVKRDKSKRAALEYLEEFEGKFWCETDERVRDITLRFEESVKAEGGGSLGYPPVALQVSGDRSVTNGREEKSQIVDRFQRIVNDTQLPRLNKMMSVLDEDILDSEQNFTFVIIDDLDRDWVDSRIENDLLRCLFRAVVDLQRVTNLKVLVALRTNIFEQLDFGSRTGGQEEKFRALSLRMRWNRKDLEDVLSARVAVASSDRGGAMRSIADLLPAANKTRGNPLDFIFDRTLMRPRDAIAFINECLVLGSGKSRLTWADLHAAERSYSRKRLLALRDEWKPTYPGIGDVLSIFNSASVLITRDEFTEQLEEIMLLPSGRDFEGVQWMTTFLTPVWDAFGSESWSETYQPIIALLFNIGLIGVVHDRRREIYTYDEPEFADSQSNLDQAIGFVIHPAFRAALDVQADRTGV